MHFKRKYKQLGLIFEIYYDPEVLVNSESHGIPLGLMEYLLETLSMANSLQYF